jgi:phage terminase small subunit
MALTVKQENFCLAYMETGNASEAYRRAYNAENMKPESVNRKAKEVMDNVKIAARLSTLQERLAQKSILTIERLTNDLLRIAKKGEDLAEAPGLSVARASLMDAAKLNGLVVDKKDHSSSDGTMTPKPALDVSKLSTETLRDIAHATSAPNAG